MSEDNENQLPDNEYIMSIGSTYLQEWKGSDAQLVVGETKLHVHSLILSIASPVFSCMFSPGFKEGQTKVVDLPGKDVINVINMLNLIYPTEHKITEPANCVALLELAREYDIKRVLNLIDDYMAAFDPKDVKTCKLVEKYDGKRTDKDEGKRVFRYSALTSDDRLALKNLETLALAVDYSLKRTTNASIRSLIDTASTFVFGTPTYKSIESSSKLCITHGKIRMMLTALEEFRTAVSVSTCDDHTQMSNFTTKCCKRETPIAIMERLLDRHIDALKAMLE